MVKINNIAAELFMILLAHAEREGGLERFIAQTREIPESQVYPENDEVEGRSSVSYLQQTAWDLAQKLDGPVPNEEILRQTLMDQLPQFSDDYGSIDMTQTLCDIMADVLMHPRNRQYVSADHTELLRKVILDPEQAAQVKIVDERNSRKVCYGCSKEIEAYTAATTNGYEWYCVRCLLPTIIPCSMCVDGRRSLSPSTIMQQLRQPCRDCERENNGIDPFGT